MIDFQDRVLRLKRPADECGKPTARVLLVAQPLQVLDAILDRFDVAKHHRRTRLQAELVRHLHHLEPLVALTFERRDSLPDGIDQNLAAAAWDRTKSRFLKPRDHFVERHLERLGKMLELRRAETVDVDMGIFFPDVLEEIDIPIEAELRMMTALHQDLHAARRG